MSSHQLVFADRQANLILINDITERLQAEAELAGVHKQLVVASRQAGMAEVATGVLHNVGNVLNSVNVSAELVAEQVRGSKSANLSKFVALLDENQAKLAAFFTADPRGLRTRDYLTALRDALAEEQAGIAREMEQMRRSIDHIKEIVTMQQTYARNPGLTEATALVELVEDALQMNAATPTRHSIEIVREYEVRPVIRCDKHRIVQILINLVRNAMIACDDADGNDRRIVVRIGRNEQGFHITVIDNGVGIPPENLTRIFAHGFTTRKKGHGFGLHSSALTAQELGGSLKVKSDGAGHGAAFTLTLPSTAESLLGNLPAA